jgi:hypothetical protein
MKGIHGLRLPSVKLGKKRITSRPIFLDWCRQVTAIANGQPISNSPVDSRCVSTIDRADSEADQMLGLAPRRKE